jgi:hypothetical protein
MPVMTDDGHLPANQNRVAALEQRIRHLEKQVDTLGSPFWKRIWFRIDGFAPWYVVERRRTPRPWHPASQCRRSTDIG